MRKGYWWNKSSLFINLSVFMLMKWWCSKSSMLLVIDNFYWPQNTCTVQLEYFYSVTTILPYHTHLLMNMHYTLTVICRSFDFSRAPYICDCKNNICRQIGACRSSCCTGKAMNTRAPSFSGLICISSNYCLHKIIWNSIHRMPLCLSSRLLSHSWQVLSLC